MADVAMEIDDSLYSRQRYVLGDTAMHRLARSNVLLNGVGGLGIEIAKNIILAGVKSLTVQDERRVTREDLGTQFFLRESDVQNNKSRAEASIHRMAELNQYVSVNVLHTELNMDTDLQYLNQYQCVILTDSSLDVQIRVNEFCRSQSPQIKFISADVRGVFSWVFCDFGQEFEIIDDNGEELKEIFISDISKGNPGIVKTLENWKHGLETGDSVKLKEVKGMEVINGMTCRIEVLTPYTFSICDTSGPEFGVYETGGIAAQVKTPRHVNFNSLGTEMRVPSLLYADLSRFNFFCHNYSLEHRTPTNSLSSEMRVPSLLYADLSRFNSASLTHLGMLAIHKFCSQHKASPNVWNKEDSDKIVELAHSINNDIKLLELDSETTKEAECLWRAMSHTYRGSLAPLCAFLGGVVAQQALIAVTGKFSPISQWLYVDAMELIKDLDVTTQQASAQPIDSRYDSLRMCVGQEMVEKLGHVKLFMIGCGAIGCEMMKNFAMLGIGTITHGGKVIVTDNDLIEMSNLNRQFLFRSSHIRKPKSVTGAEAVKDINPELNIEAHQHKVCGETEESIYTDQFFTGLDVVVNALDNVEARKYVDSRCVTNQKPLLESGTMGAKGHVQVIVPHLTESYSNQRDPVDDDVPYCTLRSFPSTIEHCIEWSRDRFETMFNQQPTAYNQFWEIYKNPANAVVEIRGGRQSDSVCKVSKLLSNSPSSWTDCVALARIKFEKLFNHKAEQLLSAFPVDTKLQDGSLFWQSPKRPPTPLIFNIYDDLHYQFIVSCAKLYADIFSLPHTPMDEMRETLALILPNVKVPQYSGKSKEIVTDESVKKPESEEPLSSDDLEESLSRLQQAVTTHPNPRTLVPAVFEKDDDSNSHIDFISSAANLRALMYSIEPVDRLKVKRIAGRIVPAIATTTAAVAGLVTVELIKLLKAGSVIESYRNAFISLALPMFVLSEPAPAPASTLSSGVKFTAWDRWEVKGSNKTTVQEFFTEMKNKYSLSPTMVLQGSRMVYVPLMPTHVNRLRQPLMNYAKALGDKPYIDLLVSYEKIKQSNGGMEIQGGALDDDDEMGPPVRFFFS